MMPATHSETHAGPIILVASAVLCDLDGTLVHSDGSIVRAWDRWCAHRRVPPAAVHAIYPGRLAEAVMGQVAPWLTEAETRADARALLDWQVEDTGDVRAMPGAASLLRSFADAGMAWAVVTPGSRALAAARIRAAGLTAPAALVAADDVARGKPDPEGYLRAAVLLGRPAPE